MPAFSMSAAVSTTITPGDDFACAISTETMRAAACGERTKAAYSVPGSIASAM
jgi:hypothetical protein